MWSISNVQPYFNAELQTHARTSNPSTGGIKIFLSGSSRPQFSNFSLFEESSIVFTRACLQLFIPVSYWYSIKSWRSLTWSCCHFYCCPILPFNLCLLKLINKRTVSLLFLQQLSSVIYRTWNSAFPPLFLWYSWL